MTPQAKLQQEIEYMDQELLPEQPNIKIGNDVLSHSDLQRHTDAHNKAKEAVWAKARNLHLGWKAAAREIQ